MCSLLLRIHCVKFLSEDRAGKYTDADTHIYTSICLSVSSIYHLSTCLFIIYVCMYLSHINEIILISPIADHHHRVHLSLAPLCICKSHKETPGSSYPVCLLICSIIDYTESNFRIANTYHCKIKPIN